MWLLPPTIVVRGGGVTIVGGAATVIAGVGAGAAGTAGWRSAARSTGGAVLWAYVGIALGDLASGTLSQWLRSRRKVMALFIALELAPLLRGANHERGLRPGTENVASVVGLGVACELARERLAARLARFVAQRERLWQGLAAAVPGLQRHGEPARCLANTLHLRFPGVTGAALLARAPEVAASTGSACHAGDGHAPAVLLAMGVPAEAARGALRLSLGPATSDAEIERAQRSLIHAWRSLCA